MKETANNADERQVGSNRWLWRILVVGAVLRAAVWLWFGDLPPMIDDELDYNALAVNLVDYHEYGFKPGVLTSLRPPLYPTLVAAVYKVCGNEDWEAVRAYQAAISLLTVCVVYRLGLAIYSQRVANWAAGFVCFYPSLVAYNSLILTETAFTLLLCAACLAIVLAFQHNRLSIWIAAGVLLGLGALTRSVLWLFPPVVAVLAIVYANGTLMRRFFAAAGICAAFAATVAPWAIRNTRLQETFTTIDVMGGRNLMMGNYEHTPLLRAWDAISIQGERSWHHVLRSDMPDAKGKTQGQIDKLAMSRGLKFIVENPLLTAQRCCVKFINFWQLDREIVAGMKSEYFGQISKPIFIGTALVIVAGYCTTLFLGIFGIFCAPPTDRRIHLLLVCFIGFVCAIHTLTFGHSRYHLPLIPIFALYAGAAINAVRSIWRQRRSFRFMAAAACCLLLVLSWGWEMLCADPQRYLNAL